MELLLEIFNVAVYSVLGVVLMILGNFLIDLVVPCHFPTEIKKDNRAVGWVSAGSFIGIGIIMKAAVMSPMYDNVKESLTNGIINTIIYFGIGVVFLIIGYLLIGLYNRKYNINEEIGKGNASAGIMIFGIFVGLAIVISGVIC